MASISVTDFFPHSFCNSFLRTNDDILQQAAIGLLDLNDSHGQGVYHENLKDIY